MPARSRPGGSGEGRASRSFPAAACCPGPPPPATPTRSPTGRRGTRARSGQSRRCPRTPPARRPGPGPGALTGGTPRARPRTRTSGSCVHCYPDRRRLRMARGCRPQDEPLPGGTQTGQTASTILARNKGPGIGGWQMATVGRDVKSVELTERELWADGPPHEVFKQMRGECPIHWTESFEEFPEEAGFWSVTTAEDIHAVSRDFRSYSSERGGVLAAAGGFPLELAQAMFIGMDPPKHDRLKALFQAGFTPRRIADHEDAIRGIVTRTLDRLDGRETCDLVTDVAQPIVSRVIGSFMGIPEEDDAIWAKLMNSTLGAGDVDLNPAGIEGAVAKDVPEIFERCRKLIAQRREHPTDDLTSVLVHAEVEGQKLEEHEIVMGFFLLVAAGNDSTKATYCSGIRALMENPEERQRLLDDPSLISSAVT